MTNQVTKIDDIPGTVTVSRPQSSPFTPRVQMLFTTSQVMTQWNKERGGKPDEGDFWLTPQNVNLGTKFYFVPCGIRDHALQTDRTGVTKESFNTSDPEFQECVAIRASNKKVEGAFTYVGQDALLWLPTMKLFAVYFFSNNAARVVEGFYKDEKTNAFGCLHILHSGQYFSKRFNKMNKTPEVQRVTEVVVGDAANNPTPEELREEIMKFRNPIVRNATPVPGVDGHPR